MSLITRKSKTLTCESGAIYSPCEKYRYKLWRKWDDELPSLNFLMLNPSTATEQKNDPTIERCQRRAVSLGYGSLIITNIFALRSTDPRGLKACDAAGGNCIEHAPGHNHQAITEAGTDATVMVLAWGAHGSYRDRGLAVRAILSTLGYDAKMRVLGWTKAGQPLHPLMVSYDTTFKYYGTLGGTNA